MKELTIVVDEATGERATAVYLPHEERAVLAHIAAGERAGTPPETTRRELRFLHLLKAELAAVLVP